MNKLVIIGKGPGYERGMFSQVEGDEVWAPSTACPLLDVLGVVPDKIFQLHQRSVFEPWLKSIIQKVVLIQPDALYSDAQVLPAQRLVDIHGFKFGSSIAWMLAWAVELGYKEIDIHGVHMAHSTEYGIQRDTFFYFVGYAQGKGVKVTLDPDSGTFIGDQKYGIEGAE